MQRYSRVHKSSDSFFSKILEKLSIVQKKMIPHIKGLDFSQRWSKMADLENSKWPPQKNLVFQLRQFSIFFMKFLWFGPWVSRIDWCEGHWNVSTYMVVRLSDISSKTDKKCVFCVFRLFVGQPHDHISWDISMPFASINSTNPRTKP